MQYLKSTPKGYRRQFNHDGVYAAATLMANDDLLADQTDKENMDAEQQAPEDNMK